MTAPNPDRLAYGVPETARLIDVSAQCIRREIAAGRLQSLVVGGRRLVEAAALDRYLDTARRAS